MYFISLILVWDNIPDKTFEQDLIRLSDLIEHQHGYVLTDYQL